MTTVDLDDLMKKRSTPASSQGNREFKGVVKKITGKLTNRPELEKEGHDEMLGRKRTKAGNRLQTDPDAYRRG